MYFTTLPDHNSAGFDEKLHFSRFGKQNIIFKADSTTGHCERHVGCLSIKTVLKGIEWYGIDNRRVALRPGQFLVLNDNQEYSSRVDQQASTKILSVFFSRTFAASMLVDASGSEEASLANFGETRKVAPEFYQTLNLVDPVMRRRLDALIHTLDTQGYHGDAVQEHLVFLFTEMLRADKLQMRYADNILCLKAATRSEIFRRLCIAKDFMHSTFTNNPDLESVSRTACLSVPQLVRQFKAAFGITPYQYLSEIRLSYAADLLSHDKTAVSDVALACGFEDNSAFARAFKTKFGVTPSHFRVKSRLLSISAHSYPSHLDSFTSSFAIAER